MARGAQILLNLCSAIETAPALSDRDVLVLTHAATEAFNARQEAFEAQGSELETAARDAIAAGFDSLDLDLEDVIAPREW